MAHRYVVARELQEWRVTNTMENFWSLVKRRIHGTYINVEPFHLFRYLNEQAYRYNFRKMTDPERFNLAVLQVVGRSLTWNEVTGKNADGTRRGSTKRQGRGKEKSR